MENRILKFIMSVKLTQNNIENFLINYKYFFEKISLDNLDNFRDVLDENVRFIDPFNNVVGQNAFIKIFKEMYNKVEYVKFEISDYSVSSIKSFEGIGYIRWVLKGVLKSNRRNISINGMSEIHFDKTGKVLAHIDHWDSFSQLTIKLPYSSLKR